MRARTCVRLLDKANATSRTCQELLANAPRYMVRVPHGVNAAARKARGLSWAYLKDHGT